MNTLLTNDMRLLMLRSYVFLMNAISLLYSGTKVVVKGLLKAIQPDKYVFFQGYSTAIHISNVKETGPGIPQIQWYYDADSLVFYKESGGEEKHIPWLAANITFNGLKLYSLDDYVGSVMYKGEEPPSAALILGGWSLYTGTVLDTNLRLELEVITEDGEELTVFPWHEKAAEEFRPLMITANQIGERVVDFDDMPLLEMAR